MAAALARLLQPSPFSDVRFRVGGRVLHANRAVLACRCEYFEKLLFGQWKEGQGPEISVEGTEDGEAFEEILRFLTTGQAKEMEAGLGARVAVLAKMYGVPQLAEVGPPVKMGVSLRKKVEELEASILAFARPMAREVAAKIFTQASSEAGRRNRETEYFVSRVYFQAPEGNKIDVMDVFVHELMFLLTEQELTVEVIPPSKDHSWRTDASWCFRVRW